MFNNLEIKYVSGYPDLLNSKTAGHFCTKNKEYGFQR